MFNCFRYLEVTDSAQIDRMTLREYQIRMRAIQYKQVDKELNLAQQSWYNQQVKATKKNGKSIYRKFKDFFDYDKSIKKLDSLNDSSLSPKQSNLAKLAKMYNLRNEKGG